MMLQLLPDHRQRSVRRGVIKNDQLEVLEWLVENGPQTFTEEGGMVVVGYDDADQRGLAGSVHGCRPSSAHHPIHLLPSATLPPGEFNLN